MAENLRVEGLDSIIRKLRRVQPTSMFRATMRNGAEMVKGWINQYPRSTSANSPGTGRWYERGYGSRWMNADGSVGGSRTSETLGRRWASDVSANGMSATVGNNASYAPLVQGKEQAWYHNRTGWRTTVEAVKEMGPRVRAFLLTQYRRAING